jgi:hypothetical protein
MWIEKDNLWMKIIIVENLMSNLDGQWQCDAVCIEDMSDSDSDMNDGHNKFIPIKELNVQLEI